MSSICGLNLLKQRDEPLSPDAANALVMAEFDRLVVLCLAVIVMLEAVVLELRLSKGEVFRLGRETVTRVA
jgi:hypothetical protein